MQVYGFTDASFCDQSKVAVIGYKIVQVYETMDSSCEITPIESNNWIRTDLSSSRQAEHVGVDTLILRLLHIKASGILSPTQITLYTDQLGFVTKNTQWYAKRGISVKYIKGHMNRKRREVHLRVFDSVDREVRQILRNYRKSPNSTFAELIHKTNDGWD